MRLPAANLLLMAKRNKSIHEKRIEKIFLHVHLRYKTEAEDIVDSKRLPHISEVFPVFLLRIPNNVNWLLEWCAACQCHWRKRA